MQSSRQQSKTVNQITVETNVDFENEYSGDDDFEVEFMKYSIVEMKITESVM